MCCSLSSCGVILFCEYFPIMDAILTSCLHHHILSSEIKFKLSCKSVKAFGFLQLFVKIVKKQHPGVATGRFRLFSERKSSTSKGPPTTSKNTRQTKLSEKMCEQWDCMIHQTLVVHQGPRRILEQRPHTRSFSNWENEFFLMDCFFYCCTLYRAYAVCTQFVTDTVLQILLWNRITSCILLTNPYSVTLKFIFINSLHSLKFCANNGGYALRND